MKHLKKFLTLLIFSVSLTLFATELHVATTGNDSNIGTAESPLRNIQTAVNKLQPGDICSVHKGTYREIITIKQSGADGAPIVIQAAKGENPIISGLDILNLKWKTTEKKGIFVAEYNSAAFEQLFMDGKPLLEARWPNVPRDKNGDWDFFSPDAWAAVDTVGNSYGTVKDADLAATSWNVTGAKAVLNVCHQFFTWTRIVEGHSSGSNSFNYPRDLGKSIKPADESGASLTFNDDRYYLVGKREFLDSPGEWYYDDVKKQLFLCTFDGKSPAKNVLEVKTRNFSLIGDQNPNFITIEGLTFFGTAFSFGKNLNNRSDHIIFVNNKVLYSSWTEFLLMPDGDSRSNLDKNFPTINADNSIVGNNVFSYGALTALFINGLSNLIENNVFNDFDLNSSLVYPPLSVSKNTPVYEGKGGKAIVRYNTIYNSGGILTQVGQHDNDFYLNDLYNAYRSCWGGNKDVSALYTSSVYCSGTRLHHNWVHEAYSGTPPFDWNGGLGIRGDDNTTGLTVDHNVVWNIGSAGIMMKNPDNPTPDQANRVMNNTIFRHSANNPVKSAMIVQTLVNQNKYSLVVNNMAESIYGHWFGKELGPVVDFSCNSTGKVIESYLENPSNFDFRPMSAAVDVLNKGKVIFGITNSVFGSAPDIGAYERGDSIYWIPGRRETKASFPIVPNGASVSSDIDVLMWRPAYKAVVHQIYFGTDANMLVNSGKFSGGKNVFTLPKLVSRQKYYWRADAVLADGSVVNGEVWSFSTTNK